MSLQPISLTFAILHTIIFNMNLLDKIYLNFISFAVVLSFVFLGFVAVFLFSIPEKSSAAFYLGIAQIAICAMGVALIIIVRKTKKRMDENTNQLERMAQKRTEDLGEALDALWGELELAKMIQTVLLPVGPAIPQYEISVYSEPAEEVGGDYYDIINIRGADWLIIGDVSGHGVTSGLVMMMTQTAIHATLEQNPNLSPSELLVLANETIRKNIKLLMVDKYIAVTALAIHKEGEFLFSGLHQDIVIFRSESKKIEKVETNGMWIGIVDGIKNFLSDNKLTLNINDTMLLYTDGITEARKNEAAMSAEKSIEYMFGLDRLINIFKEYGESHPDQIREKILKELDNYYCPDDITMIILKRIE